MRVHWYHRATGKPLEHDPATAAGLLEIASLDAREAKVEAAGAFASGTYASLWAVYAGPRSEAWTRLKPRTRSDYQAVRDWLGDAAAGAMVLSAVTAPQMERLRDKAFAEKGRRFANYVVQVLRLTWGWGIKRGLAKVNPLAETETIRKPKGERHVNREWKAHEVEAFMTDCPFQLLVPFALGLFAGMRQGDALRVTWSAYGHNRGAIEWTAAKNGQACAAEVSGIFAEILDKARAQRGDAVQIAVNSKGFAWSESGFRASFFKRLRTLAKSGAVAPGCTFHGLRHTIGAHARNTGESDSRIAAAIGDRSTAMAQIYGRDADRATAQAEVLGSVQKRFDGIPWQRARK